MICKTNLTQILQSKYPSTLYEIIQNLKDCCISAYYKNNSTYEYNETNEDEFKPKSAIPIYPRYSQEAQARKNYGSSYAQKCANEGHKFSEKGDG